MRQHFSSKPSLKKIPFTTAIILACMFLLYLLAPFDSDLFNKLSIQKRHQSELWRYLLGHFLHTDFNHLVWNFLAVLLLGVILEGESVKLMISSWIVGTIAVSTWFTTQSNFGIYVGVSGILNTVFVSTLYAMRAPSKKLIKGNGIIWLVFIIYVGKNVYEYLSGTALLSNTHWESTPAAHIAGMIGGLVVVFLDYLSKKINRQNNNG